jgi:hypothetical protein
MLQTSIVDMGGSKKKPMGSEKSNRASGPDGDKFVKKEETKKPSGKVQQKQKLSVLVEERSKVLRRLPFKVLQEQWV